MRLPSCLLLLATTASLAACATVPPPEVSTPTPELPASFAYAPETQVVMDVAALLPGEDPAYATLSEAALADAPSLLEAMARVDAARANARGAGAERLPNIGLEGSVTGNRINPNQFGSNNPIAAQIDTEQVQYGANLTASWDLDIFGRLKAQERAAVARIDAANASAAAVRNALLAEIAGSVIDWRTLQDRSAAITSDIEAATRLAQLGRTREEAGIAPGFDRVRAEAQASASRSRLAALESERVRIVGRLVTLTGRNAGDVRAMLDLAHPVLAPAPAPASLPSELLANRPDVVAAAAELAASDANLAAAAAARFPRFTLSAALGLLSFDLGDFFDEDSIVGTLAAGVAGPLIDFGRVGAQIDASAANKRIAFQAYRGAVFTALGDAEAGYGLIASADAEARLAMAERDQLTRAANLANDRFRAGLSSFLEVLEARRAADGASERAALAMGRAQRARVILWQALGGSAQDQSQPTP